jgi:hypothetical protein
MASRVSQDWRTWAQTDLRDHVHELSISLSCDVGAAVLEAEEYITFPKHHIFVDEEDRIESEARARTHSE